MNAFMFFPAGSPMVWILIVGTVFLLFGAGRIPQLARALGQSKRALKDALSTTEQERQPGGVSSDRKQVPLSAVDDEALFAEAHRRTRLRSRV